MNAEFQLTLAQTVKDRVRRWSLQRDRQLRRTVADA